MKPTSKIRKTLFIIIPLIILVLVALRLKSNKDTGERQVYRYDKTKAITVETETARLEKVSDAETFSGTFEPNRESKISADVQGKINSVLVDVGSNVYKGQVVIRLDNSLLKLQLQSIDVQIEGLQDDVKRYTALAHADAIQGVQLEKARLGLRSARVQRATLVEQINKTAVKAPFNGVVTAKLNEVGGFAAPGVPILQITDISILKFTVNVPEKDLSLFPPGKHFNITSDVSPNTTLSGTVIMTASKANPGNSFPVQFQVANTQSLSIKSGMFGRVNVKSERNKTAISIPSSAISEQNGITQVYLVINGKAVSTPVTVSESIGNRSIVTEGLNEGDVIITTGFINLFNGANIVVR